MEKTIAIGDRVCYNKSITIGCGAVFPFARKEQIDEVEKISSLGVVGAWGAICGWSCFDPVFGISQGRSELQKNIGDRVCGIHADAHGALRVVLVSVKRYIPQLLFV